MGFMEYMKLFAKEYQDTGGFVRRDRLTQWFGGKTAEVRDGYTQEMRFETKSAVLIVGASGIGKTTYVQNLLKSVTGFKLISSDWASYAKADEEQKTGKALPDGWASQYVENEIKENKECNLVIDSVFINPVHRAAMLRYLTDLGYTTFIIYFSKKYTDEKIDYFLSQRAAELVLFEDYLRTTNTKKMKVQDLMKVRENIVEERARATSTDPKTLMCKTLLRPETRIHKTTLKARFNQEIESNRVWWQEKRGVMYLGADYCYVL